jgi:N6-L-threonylcarbamoyladenine synthase
MGKTRDDAAGEAFDKVAKLLGFGYPGGPLMDALAPYGDPDAVRFTLAKMKGNAMDFSFSGLKTAVLRWFESRDMAEEVERRKELARSDPRPDLQQWLALTPQPTLDVIASFQKTVVRELTRRIEVCADEINAKTVIVSGGVACNRGLREAATEQRVGARVLFPTPGLSTDNAAMIAAAAFPKLRRREFSGFDLAAKASLPLA